MTVVDFYGDYTANTICSLFPPTQTITPSNSLCKTYLLFGGTINQTTFVGLDCDGFPFDFFLEVYDTQIFCAQSIAIAFGDGSFQYLGGCPIPTPTATPTPTDPFTGTTQTPTPSPTNTLTPSATITPIVTGKQIGRAHV